MQLKFWKHIKIQPSFFLYMKCAGILLLFVFSVLIVACGSSPTDSSGLGQPTITVTIQLGDNGSPTPPLPEYTCSAWATNTTPTFNTVSTVNVYTKFVRNVQGNPEGIGNAVGVAVFHWPDGTSNEVQATTTSDGLAVFSISTAQRAADINKLTTVTVMFSNPPCQGQAAFFTLIIVSPTATVTKVPSPTVSPSPTGTGTPTGSPTPGATGTPTGSPSPTPTKKTPTPTPTP